MSRTCRRPRHVTEIVCRRLLGVAAAALILAPSAKADIGLRITTKTVHVGGTLRGWSSGSGFPVFIVPSALAPKRHRCHNGTAICEPTSRRPPRRPFVFLGRVPGRVGDYARHRFAFRVPLIRPGLYRVFIYCRPCNGGLIQSGDRLEGETITVLP
jgi:hypothetical protein